MTRDEPSLVTQMTGTIEVEKVIEHEDGSATVIFECDDDTRQMLVGEGLKALLEKAVDKANSEYDYIEGLPKEDESA